MAANKSLKDRFLPKVNMCGPNGCWLWTAATRGNGYGSIKVNNKVEDAHRISHILFKGEIPEGMLVMHTCDNRACVNPDHLRLGTYSDNHNDAIAKGRVKPFKITRTEPLTEMEIDRLRNEYKCGVSKRMLSIKYQLPPTSLARLLKDAS